jgi:hypothetical protein
MLMHILFADYHGDYLHGVCKASHVDCKEERWCLFRCISNEGDLAPVRYCYEGVDNNDPESNDFCDTS